MKESPGRYINPFLSDKENDKVNLLNNDNVNFSANLEDEKCDKSAGLLEKAKGSYIDKNVTECQVPEFVACHEENCYHVVKDICVDEGLSHELSCCPVTVNGDKHDGMINDDIDSLLLPSNCPSDKIKPIESNSLNNSIKTDEPSNNGVNDVDQQITEVQCFGSEAKELRETNQTVDISNEMKTEENTISNSDNVKPSSVTLELPLEAQIAPNHHDIASNNITVAARGGGESSFSMAGSVLGLITYSGPVASSGSISHRSDGSNSSVRSFAFPILQNEWNSSPVRMTKMDQVQSPKHRGWRQTLMCCRF